MTPFAYRYRFLPETPAEDLEAALLLALLATESLHGGAQTRLDASHALDLVERTLVIDASTNVGRDLNRLFLGFADGEFGAGAFQIERVATETRQAVAGR